MAKQSIRSMHALLDYLPKECGRSWADDAIKKGIPAEYRDILEDIAAGAFVFGWGVCKSFYSVSDGNLSWEDEGKLVLF